MYHLRTTIADATVTLAVIGSDSEMPHKDKIAFGLQLPYVPGSDSPAESGRLYVENGALRVIRGVDDTQTCAVAFFALLSFLSASAEAYEHGMRTGERSENADTFPDDVALWAYMHSDEIAGEYAEYQALSESD